MKADLFKDMFKNIKRGSIKHSPELLTGIGIAGMIMTTVVAVRATPKALQLIEERRDELELGQNEKLGVVETVKATWKCYVPAVITGVTSTACIIKGCSVSARRTAAFATAYNLSTAALSEYKEKVIETIGEEKETEIREKIAKDKLEKDPARPSSIIVTGNGNTRCYDTITKQRFISDIPTIQKTVNELNRRMVNGEDYISLNDLYYELGVDPVEVGDERGWNVLKGLIDVSFHGEIDTDGTPCVVIDYTTPPRPGFNCYS